MILYNIMLYYLISQYIMLCYIKFYTIIHIISYHCYFQVHASHSPFPPVGMGSRQQAGSGCSWLWSYTGIILMV